MARKTQQTSKLSARDRAKLHGYRSGLEETLAEQLNKAGVKADYEAFKIPYVKPAKEAKYTPDFVLPNGIIIESKGRYVTQDRHKHLLIKVQHPDLDIRFVFSNSRQRISKQSKTTYSMWASKNGYQFSDVLIPQAWIDEPYDERRFEALRKLQR